MKPSEQAKAAGLKNLAQVTNITGVPQRTILNWEKNKPELFAIILKGCVASSIIDVLHSDINHYPGMVITGGNGNTIYFTHDDTKYSTVVE